MGRLYIRADAWCQTPQKEQTSCLASSASPGCGNSTTLTPRAICTPMLVPVAGADEFRLMRCRSIGDQKVIPTARDAEYASQDANSPVAFKAGSSSSED